MRLALLIAIFISCVNAACPLDFVASVTVPGKCYHLTTTLKNFFSAISYCRNNLTYGADILSIANGFENSEVASLLRPRGIADAWVGNAFYDNESHWIAITAGNSNYSNWGSGNNNTFAALITTSGSWDSGHASDDYPTICQLYPDDPTTFPPPQITCPAGWTPSISVRGKCYQEFDSDWTDFFSATRSCLTTRIGDSHAELVTLTSQLEIMELLTIGYNPWASLTSWEADGHWRWIETLHPTDYFGPYGQPTKYLGGTCASLDYDNLHGSPCWYEQGAVCQYFPYEPPAPTPSDLNCPQDGIASLTKLGTCYYVLNQNQTFQSAQSACQKLNFGFDHNDLFVPRTVAEYEEFEAIVASQISYPRVWFGLTSYNGNWGWISGRSSNISNIWCDGQPDNSNGQCGFVISSPSDQICWRAGDCRDYYAAVCQSSNTF